LIVIEMEFLIKMSQEMSMTLIMTE
jgi:hypothetical protein